MLPELGILLNTPKLLLCLDSQYIFKFTFQGTTYLWELRVYIIWESTVLPHRAIIAEDGQNSFPTMGPCSEPLKCNPKAESMSYSSFCPQFTQLVASSHRRHSTNVSKEYLLFGRYHCGD